MDKILPSFQYDKSNIVPLKLYLVSVPLIIFATTINDIDFKDSLNITMWIIVSVISVLICGVFVLLVKYFLFEKAFKNKIPASVVLFYGIVLGFLKGSSTFYMAVWIGIYTPNELNPEGITRMMVATLLGIWFVMTTPIVLTYLRNYKDSTQDLIMFTANVEQENYQVEQKILSMQTKIQDEFGEELLNIIESTRPYLNDDSQASKTKIDLLIQKIKNVNDLTVRPASHRLWLESHQTHPDLDLKTLVTSALRLKPFPKTFVILVYFASTVFGLFEEFGYSGLIAAFANAIMIYLTYFIAEKYYKNRKLNYTKFLLVPFLAALIINVVNNYIFFSYDFVSFIAYTFLGFVWLSYLTFAVSIILTSKIKKELVIKEIRKISDAKLIENIKLRDFENTINFQLAKFMHGQVQNKLVSTALNLEKAAKRKDRDQINLLISELSHDIQDNFGLLSTYTGEKNISDFLENLKEGWKGICEISFEVEQSLQRKESDIYLRANEAIAEAVSNSVHHGKAENAHIKLARIDDNRVQIDVVDDGIGIESSFAGLGSKIYDNLSGHDWTLKLNENGKGAILQLTFYCPLTN
jgi:hypothetical protein